MANIFGVNMPNIGYAVAPAGQVKLPTQTTGSLAGIPFVKMTPAQKLWAMKTDLWSMVASESR